MDNVQNREPQGQPGDWIKAGSWMSHFARGVNLSLVDGLGGSAGPLRRGEVWGISTIYKKEYFNMLMTVPAVCVPWVILFLFIAYAAFQIVHYKA